MKRNRPRFTRRTLLAAAGALVAAPSLAEAAKHRRKAAPAKDDAAGSGTSGLPLPIPARIDLVDGEVFELVAQPAMHAFVKGDPVGVVGYGGTYMGPALRVKRGARPRIRLVNRLDRPTNVHWHGLLVPSTNDGATRPGLAPGESWETELPVDQPAATLWYHAHVHGHVTRDVHDGLAGLLIVEDDDGAGLGLPSTWGVDDIPLVLQDRLFDPSGRPMPPDLGATMEHGFRGPDMIVNGVKEAVARVPRRAVRLRLLNAAGARTFRLGFEDQRPFRLLATDGGLVEAPVELSFLVLAPGERAEILVDFGEGGADLLTGPDFHEHRQGAEATIVPDVIDRPVRLVRFETTADTAARMPLPERLSELAPLPKATGDLRRRRFELRVRPNPAVPLAGRGHQAMHMGSMTHDLVGSDADGARPAALLTINGRVWSMSRIDETVSLGATEVWEVVCPEMAHPFHIHGVQFRVLSEDGDLPKSWNRGAKDTIYVENSAELLVTFTRTAAADLPFLYHCHLLEHEDGGMMGSVTVA